jgi:hypothetical protein
MNFYHSIIVLMTGFWLVLSSFLVSPNKNWQSKMFFKFIPFMFGLMCLYVGAKGFGWI